MINLSKTFNWEKRLIRELFKMEITEINVYFKSTIEVLFDNHKSIIISGEWTTTPAFYADKISIKKWNNPFANIVITELEKKEIIDKILEYSKKNGPLPIYFEY